jgi:hypothetical protein
LIRRTARSCITARIESGGAVHLTADARLRFGQTWFAFRVAQPETVPISASPRFGPRDIRLDEERPRVERHEMLARAKAERELLVEGARGCALPRNFRWWLRRFCFDQGTIGHTAPAIVHLNGLANDPALQHLKPVWQSASTKHAAEAPPSPKMHDFEAVASVPATYAAHGLQYALPSHPQTGLVQTAELPSGWHRPS